MIRRALFVVAGTSVFIPPKAYLRPGILHLFTRRPTVNRRRVLATIPSGDQPGGAWGRSSHLTTKFARRSNRVSVLRLSPSLPLWSLPRAISPEKRSPAGLAPGKLRTIQDNTGLSRNVVLGLCLLDDFGYLFHSKSLTRIERFREP